MLLHSNNKTLVIFEILKKLMAKQEIYLSDTEPLEELGIKEQILRIRIDEIKFYFQMPY